MTPYTALDVEGLALNGFVKEVDLLDCDGSLPRKSKLRVRLTDGKVVESECSLYERVVRSYLVILKYIEFGRSIAIKQIDEESIKDLKFDAD